MEHRYRLRGSLWLPKPLSGPPTRLAFRVHGDQALLARPNEHCGGDTSILANGTRHADDEPLHVLRHHRSPHASAQPPYPVACLRCGRFRLRASRCQIHVYPFDGLRLPDGVHIGAIQSKTVSERRERFAPQYANTNMPSHCRWTQWLEQLSKYGGLLAGSSWATLLGCHFTDDQASTEIFIIIYCFGLSAAVFVAVTFPLYLGGIELRTLQKVISADSRTGKVLNKLVPLWWDCVVAFSSVPPVFILVALVPWLRSRAGTSIYIVLVSGKQILTICIPDYDYLSQSTPFTVPLRARC